MATKLTNAQETVMLTELRGKLFGLYAALRTECVTEHQIEATEDKIEPLAILHNAGFAIDERLRHLENERKLHGDVEQVRGLFDESTKRLVQRFSEQAKKASDNGNEH